MGTSCFVSIFEIVLTFRQKNGCHFPFVKTISCADAKRKRKNSRYVVGHKKSPNVGDFRRAKIILTLQI
jgi:hypothetical protein